VYIGTATCDYKYVDLDVHPSLRRQSNPNGPSSDPCSPDP